MPSPGPDYPASDQRSSDQEELERNELPKPDLLTLPAPEDFPDERKLLELRVLLRELRAEADGLEEAMSLAWGTLDQRPPWK